MSAKLRVVSQSPRRIWIARIGVASFLFFLMKGLVWLAVGGVAVAYTWF